MKVEQKINNIFQKNTKQIIAHRGLCSIFPQNTLQAIIAGLHSSNFTQFDVHLTKDNQVVVFHDRFLSRLTDVSQHPQFREQVKKLTIDDYQECKTDWWLRDFTLAQLRMLKIHQPIATRPQLQSFSFKISTLQQIIQQALKISTSLIHKNLKTGLLIQIKEEIAATLTQRDQVLCKKIQELLIKYDLSSERGRLKNNLNVVIQSFNIPLLSYIVNVDCKLIQLYDKDVIITKQLLQKNRSKNIKGIGVTSLNLLNLDGKPDQQVKRLCQQMNYFLYYWTIRDDDINDIPFGLNSYRQAYLKLQQLGVNGFITQFPDKCKGIFQIQNCMYQKTQKKQKYKQLNNER